MAASLLLYPSDECVELPGPRGALPDNLHAPTQPPQCENVAAISFNVARELVVPESGAGPRRGCLGAARVTVPEATVDKDHRIPSRQHDIRRSREISTVESEAEACLMQPRPHHPLRFGIASLDPRHHPAAGGAIHDVHGPSGRSGSRLAFARGSTVPDDDRHQGFPDGLDNRDRDGIAELPVGLRVGHRDAELVTSGPVEAHQPRAFPRGQPSRWALRPAHEDLRAVLEIACRERPCDVLRTDDAEAKAIPLGQVLGRIVLQVAPEMRRKNVLLEHTSIRRQEPLLAAFRPIFGVEDRGEARALVRVRKHDGAPIERLSDIGSDSDDEDTFSMLREEPLGIDDLPRDVVAKLLDQRTADHLEGPTPIVRGKILHVLEHERLRLLCGDDPLDVEEKRALGLAFETMLPAKRVLLGDPGDRERLAGEAGQQDVVVGNLLNGDLGDVAVDGVIAEIRPVGDLGILVPLGGKDAPTAGRLEPAAEATDPREEVDKGEAALLRVGALGLEAKEILVDGLADRGRTGFPAGEGPRRITDLSTQLFKGQADGLP